MKKKQAFTMIELIIVIVVLGILGKYGVEFMAQAYRNYINQHLMSKLQGSSSIAAEFIASRLKYRIRDSIIIRRRSNFSDFRSLEGYDGTGSYDILEWVAYDGDSFRSGLWSGIIDQMYAHSTSPAPDDIYTPGTDTSAVNSYIQTLSNNATTIADAAIYIKNFENDIQTGYGWDGNAITDQNRTMHPITNDTNVSKFKSSISGVTLSVVNENIRDDSRYYLSWTAYAVVLNTSTSELWFYYDYQPWNGEKYSDATTKKKLIMSNVDTFKMIQINEIIKLQVCTTSDINFTTIDGDKFAICSEKIVY